MVGVDVCGLDVDQALRVLGRGAEALTEELGDDLDELRVQPRESLQLLLSTSIPWLYEQRMCTHRTRAIMTNLHQLLIHQLHTPQARRLQQLDLRLHQQIERDLGHEQARPRAGAVADRGADVLVVEVVGGVDGGERGAEDVVEDVVDARAARELLGGDVDGGAVDGGDKVARELGHEAEDERALLPGFARA